METEYGIAIRFLVGAVIQCSATDYPAPMLVHEAYHDTAAWYFSVDALLQVSVDGFSELLRRGCTWKAHQKWSEASDLDDFSEVHVFSIVARARPGASIACQF
jgi:hypothetical protein